MKEKQIINLQSELFEPVLRELDKHLKNILLEVEENNFEEGQVSLKIIVSTEEKSKIAGEYKYDFKQPRIKYAIKSDMKHTYSGGETFNFEDYELRRENDEFVIEKVDDGQLNIIGELNK